jgi:hemolysin III
LHPRYTKNERIVDGCIHGAGILFSLGGTTALLVASRDSPALDIATLTIYSFGMITMFVSSACYNLLENSTHKDLLRRIDHAAIFIMIAGSYTPFALLKMSDSVGLALFSLVWAIAMAGVLIKICSPRRIEGLSIALYLAQGWAILLALNPLISSVSSLTLYLLGVGGVIYTIGVVFHLSDRLPFHNAIWHGLVLLAATCHYVAIYRSVILIS